MLIAASDNEAYNTLVCAEFAHEIGTDSVYQLGEGEGGGLDDSDPRKLPKSLRGRALFTSGLGQEDVEKRQMQGWVFRKTRLTAAFDLEDARAALPEGADMLMLLRPDGSMRFFTHAAVPAPEADDTIISFAPPEPEAGNGAAAAMEDKPGTQPA